MSAPRIVVGGLVLCSAGLLTFLGLWEKREHTVYADKLAGGLPTACEGLTRHITDTPIIVGEVWPDEKCEFEVTRAVLKVQRQLLTCFHVEPPQEVFDAATSHAWNFGASATCGSAAMAAWRQEQWALGCRRLQLSDTDKPVWSYIKTGRTLPNGKPEYQFVRGLANRRSSERGMCMEGVR